MIEQGVREKTDAVGWVPATIGTILGVIFVVVFIMFALPIIRGPFSQDTSQNMRVENTESR